MSPIFEPDKNVRATTRIYPRGEYEAKLTRVRGLGYTKDNGDDVAGARYFLEMVGKVQNDGTIDDEHAGEDMTPHRTYVHTEGAVAFTKRFLMAAMGYGRNDEESFDEDWWLEADLSVDFDEEEVSLGTAWEDPVGNTIRIQVDVDEYEGQEQQVYNAFAPLP